MAIRSITIPKVIVIVQNIVIHLKQIALIYHHHHHHHNLFKKIQFQIIIPILYKQQQIPNIQTTHHHQLTLPSANLNNAVQMSQRSKRQQLDKVERISETVHRPPAVDPTPPSAPLPPPPQSPPSPQSNRTEHVTSILISLVHH